MKVTDALPTDAELVEKCLAGDLNAFGKIVDRYRNTIYGLCYHKVRNFEDAEELAQDTFLRAYLSLKQLRDATKLAPWLYSIATNFCRMWLRARKEEEVPLEEFVSQQDISPSPQEQLETEELHSLVRMALNRVSENSHLVMTLFYLDGCSYEEIAASLGVPIKTVKSRLYEARKQLRRELLRIVEELFKGHKLKDDFTKDVLARCRCGCLYPNDNQQKTSSLKSTRKEVTKMAAKKRACGCGCIQPMKNSAKATKSKKKAKTKKESK